MAKAGMQPEELDPLPSERIRTTPGQVEFARTLRKAMKEKGMTASALAAAVWGSRETEYGERTYKVARNRDRIGVYLRGHGYPRVETLDRIADALGMKPMQLAPELVTAHVPPSMAMSMLDNGRMNVNINTVLPANIALQIADLIRQARAELIEA